MTEKDTVWTESEWKDHLAMTDRIVRPVRAWADYDEWSVYLEDYWSGTDNPSVDRQWFRRYDIPRNGTDRMRDDTGATGIVHALYRPSAANVGALRSLRVLYDNWYGLTLGYDREFSLWDWFLAHPDNGPCAKGDFAEDKDSEAVERAMIAAAAWFSQRQDGV